MPKVTVDGQVYDYDPSKMLNTEAIALQKVTGMTVPEWTTALQTGDAYALTGLVWLVYRRNGREVAFDEVEFDIGGLELAEDEEPADPTLPPVEADAVTPA
jgi:hypothetical protein